MRNALLIGIIVITSLATAEAAEFESALAERAQTVYEAEVAKAKQDYVRAMRAARLKYGRTLRTARTLAERKGRTEEVQRIEGQLEKLTATPPPSPATVTVGPVDRPPNLHERKQAGELTVIRLDLIRYLEESGQRPPGYEADYRKRAEWVDEDHGLVWISRDAQAALKDQYWNEVDRQRVRQHYEIEKAIQRLKEEENLTEESPRIIKLRAQMPPHRFSEMDPADKPDPSTISDGFESVRDEE